MTGAQARGQVVRRLEASELSPEATQAAMKFVRAVTLAATVHGCDLATLPPHERDTAAVVAVEMAKMILDALVEDRTVTS